MNIYRWLVTVIIIAVTIAGLGFFKFQQIQAGMAMAASFPEPSAAVNTTVTELSSYQSRYKVTGQAVAPQVVQLQNEFPGVIEQVNFIAGEKVSKGQLLLVVNFAEEQAQLSATKARLKLAKTSLERVRTLLAEDRISQQDFDVAEAQYHIEQANVANLTSIISRKKITAPFSGTLSLDTYQQGQYLSANSMLTTLVGDNDKIWVDFQLPQTKAQLEVGDTINIQSINGAEQSDRTATIIAKDSQIKAQSRHLQYRAELVNEQSWLHHNEIVQIDVPEVQQQVVLVPDASISRNHFGSFVFKLVVDDNNQYRAERVEVKLGKRDGDLQVVLSGLDADVLIATEGAFKLNDGLLVYPNIENKSSLSAQLLLDGAQQ